MWHTLNYWTFTREGAATPVPPDSGGARPVVKEEPRPEEEKASAKGGEAPAVVPEESQAASLVET